MKEASKRREAIQFESSLFTRVNNAKELKTRKVPHDEPKLIITTYWETKTWFLEIKLESTKLLP